MSRVANAREGSVLIVALGVLTLLSIIGSIFATMMRFESVAASNYVIEMKAKLLAESGVAKATRAIQQVASESAYTSTVKVDVKINATGMAGSDGIPDRGAWIYFGEDADEDNVLDSGEDVNSNGKLDTLACPVEQSTHPSFDIDWKGPESFSGTLGNTFQAGKDGFRIKAVDSNSILCVNDENTNMATMINTLCGQLGIASYGTAIMAGRPAAGYSNKEEIRKASSATVSDWAILNSYLALHAYVDDWLPPEAVSETDRRGRVIVPTTLASQRRAPININAAPREVLVSLFTGISGAVRVTIDKVAVPLGSTATISTAMAETLADAVIKFRTGTTTPADYVTTTSFGIPAEYKTIGPFKSMMHFYYFLAYIDLPGWSDTKDESGSVPRREYMSTDRAAVFANCNPNSDLNKFNPDFEHYKVIDKSDLTAWTTEVCFGPMGFFELESAGVIMQNPTDVVGMKKITVYTKLWNVHRDSTQEEFETNRYFTAAYVETLDDKDYTEATVSTHTWFPCTTVPEYQHGLDLTTLSNTTSPFKRAHYDGAISMVSLMRMDSAFNTFACDFARQTLNAYRGRNWDDNITNDPDGGTTWGSPAKPPLAPINSTSHRPKMMYDKASGTGGPQTLIDTGASGLAMFERTDLLPDGIRLSEARGRMLRYDGRLTQHLSSRYGVIMGTVMFWVKFDKAVSDISGKRYFYRSGDYSTAAGAVDGVPAKTTVVTSGKVTFTSAYAGNGIAPTASIDQILVYLDGSSGTKLMTAHIPRGASVNQTSLASPYSEDLTDKLTVDVSKWRAGEWHSVEVHTGLTAEMYVDGVKASGAIDFPLADWPSATKGLLYSSPGFLKSPSTYSSQLAWITSNIDKLPMAIQPSTKGGDPSDSDTIGDAFWGGNRYVGTSSPVTASIPDCTVDNLLFTEWKLRDPGSGAATTGPLFARYYDKSYRAIGEDRFAIFEKEIEDMELSTVPFTIASCEWTYWLRWNSAGTASEGQVEFRLQYDASGGTSFTVVPPISDVTTPDSYPGMVNGENWYKTFAGAVVKILPITMPAGSKVVYKLEIEPTTDTTVQTTPMVDDVTIKWFTNPVILSWNES